MAGAPGVGATGEAGPPAAAPDVPRLVVVSAGPPSAALVAALAHEGYPTRLVTDGEVAGSVDPPDGVVIDASFPGALEVCQRLRARWRVPILVAATGPVAEDAVAALEAGADAYLADATRTRELVARTRALLRRRSRPRAEESLPLVVGDVAVDRARHRAWWQGTAVTLTPKEFDLLELLLAHAGQVLARAVLLRRVWGQATRGGDKTLEVHVSRLRAKVEEDPARPRRILTVRGVGYRYRAVPPGAPGARPEGGG